jgi:hypothetical protein
VAKKVVRSDQVAKYPRLTIVDKELASAVHYDTDNDSKLMYLGPPLVVVTPLEAERALCSLARATIVITSTDYPQRLVFKLLERVQAQFKETFGAQIAGNAASPASRMRTRSEPALPPKFDACIVGAQENQFNNHAKKAFESICVQ